MKIQLIYSDDCPHVEAARAALLRSLVAEDLSVSFEELDVAAPGTPAHLREWGSPTILIDGVDVGGETAPTGPCCRLYDAARRGIPSDAMIVEALRRSKAVRLDLPRS
jgi:mercuric ion transport protein